VVQGASAQHKPKGFLDWTANPEMIEVPLTLPGKWSLLDPGAGPVNVRGRLIGGCIETVSILAGTPFGDLRSFAAAHAPEGLIVYVEASADAATDIARHMWRMRLAGWFDHANAVLIGRTTAPDSTGFTQLDAVRSVLGDLKLPVILDVDCGHVFPHLALVNGALTTVAVEGDFKEITQELC
jgi:muramoyltetrapeptide carboxypeptidase LdcA involved in peptidoglycan recycling